MKNLYVSSIKDEGEEIFKLAEEFALGIEILVFSEPHLITNESERIQLTKKKLINIEHRALHGPFLDLFPASRDPEIVKVVKSRFYKAYETSKALGAKHLILHAGYIPKAYFPDSWLESCLGFWKDFLSQHDSHLEIHIENVCEDDYALIDELIKEVNNPLFSACLDIGHAHINSPKSLEHWIKGLGSSIKHVHLHNNDGVRDGHHGICRGTIDILSTLELLETYAPEANWSLETKLLETRESVLWLQREGFLKR